MRTIEINGTKIPVRIGHRAMIEFERLAGKPSVEQTTLEDTTMLLYCAVRQGAKNSGIAFSMTFEEFIDYCDEHPEVVFPETTQEQAQPEPAEKKSLTT